MPVSVTVDTMNTILILHGPNLNLLGTREPEHYGTLSLSDINEGLEKFAAQAGYSVIAQQSNAEHELIGWVQQAPVHNVGFIVINPAAFTHTSVALRDAILAAGLPFIEVHMSNVYAREPFRHHSYFSGIAKGVICGLGPQGYKFALQAAIAYLKNE